MITERMTCRCRHCGRMMSYSSGDIGMIVECKGCRKEITLPGHLQKFAAIQKVRRSNMPGLILELSGFALLLIWPWGTFAGLIVIWAGYRKSYQLICTSCGESLSGRTATACPHCKAVFAGE